MNHVDHRKCGFIKDALCHCEPDGCPFKLRESGNGFQIETEEWHNLQRQALSCGHLEWVWPVDVRRFSASEIKLFKSCRVQWHFSSANELNRTSGHPNKNLWLGHGVHEALAAGYSLKAGNIAYLSVVKGAFLSWLYNEGSGMASHDWKRLQPTAELGETMLDHYALWAPKRDDFEVVGTEMHFRVPLPSLGPRISYVGVIDALVKDSKGAYWILEHKTAGRFPDFSTLPMDAQGVSYVWALQRDPNFAGVKPKGIMYNYLLKKAPYIPKSLARGGLEKRSNMNTSAEIYLRELRRQDLQPAPYRAFMAMLERKRAFFKRLPITYSARRMKTFQKLLFSTIREMVAGPPIYPRGWRGWDDCSRCEFRAPCSMFISGTNYEVALETMFVEGRRREPAQQLEGG